MEFDKIGEFIEENPGKVSVGMYGVFLTVLAVVSKVAMNKIQKSVIQQEAVGSLSDVIAEVDSVDASTEE